MSSQLPTQPVQFGGASNQVAQTTSDQQVREALYLRHLRHAKEGGERKGLFLLLMTIVNRNPPPGQEFE